MTDPLTSKLACSARIVLTTCANQQQAEQLVKGLIEAQLVACVNLIPGLQSWYQWQEKICNDPELQLVIKTKQENIKAVMGWLEAHHPYETPEILVLAAETGSKAYLNWIQDVC